MGKKDKGNKESSKPNASAVKSCSCQHEYQDKIYSKGQRLKIFNTKGQWVCTVCNRS